MKQEAIQTMDITTLKAVISEIKKELTPSRFEKAQQPDSKTIQLGFRTLEKLCWIEISWHAEAPRIIRINPPKKTGDKSTLAKQIQHILNNLALIKIEQKGFERIVKFSLANRPGEDAKRELVIELMGRHSNFLILDQKGKVITLGRKVKESQSRLRPIGTGDVYSPPPKLKGKEPRLEETFEIWKKRISLIPIPLKEALQQCYQGISPSISLQLAAITFDSAERIANQNVNEIKISEWTDLHKRWRLWLHSIVENKFTLKTKAATDFQVWEDNSQDPSSNKIDYFLSEYYKNKLMSRQINLLYTKTERKLIKAKDEELKFLKEQTLILSRIAEYKSMQEEANRIFCTKSPTKDQINAAQKLFKLAKKKKRSKESVNERITHHKQRLSNIDDSFSLLKNLINTDIEECEDKLERLIDLQQEIETYLFPAKGKNISKRKFSKQVISPMEIKSPNNLLIQIGRNHRQNELISLRKATKGDFWFHSQECPGSHVVLKASNGISEEEDFQMAADFAAFFSKARGNKIVPVVMVPIENLHKIPGALPGTVSYKGGQVLWGEVENAMQHIQQQRKINVLSS